MDIRLHNTLSGKKELFTPINPDRVTMYVCGPTVYNYVHIGNGRPAVVFDVLFRLLNLYYDNVIYAANVTDIDDKINAAAKENGESIQALADRYTDAYQQDIAALGMIPATVVPRATEHIDVIIEMISELIAKDFAYFNDGHVLFSVPADAEYGSLSKRTLEDMLDGARVEVAPYKRDAKDFVLWKPSTDDLPGWDSPWGRGRPGWHIECSAMIRKHLGTSIDIHGGGSDLTFPHHENEAAQSRCANDHAEYVRYWLHNGMLTLGSEKMSKSVGNVRTIHELCQHHSGEALRYALLSGQYRSPLAWTEDLLAQSQRSLDGLYQALRQVPDLNQTSTDYQGQAAADYPQEVVSVLADDLNTPQALAAMHGIARAINKSDQAAEKMALGQKLLAGGWLLGILHQPVQAYFQGSGAEADGDFAARVEDLINKRNEARASKEYAAADAHRDALTELGVELEDTRDGTRWKLIN